MRHPLHPALVHFPVACWALATAVDALGLVVDSSRPWQLAIALMALGCGFGLLAALAGFFELLKLPEGHPALATANAHMGLALTTCCLYGGSLFLRMRAPLLGAPDGWALALSGAGLLALLATGWLGGQLVYGHGVGVAAAAAQPASQSSSRRQPDC